SSDLLEDVGSGLNVPLKAVPWRSPAASGNEKPATPWRAGFSCCYFDGQRFGAAPTRDAGAGPPPALSSAFDGSWGLDALEAERLGAESLLQTLVSPAISPPAST